MLKEVIKGQNVITIKVKAGDIQPIEYEQVASVDVVNYTDGTVFVSDKNDFEMVNNVGNYLTVTDGNSYNSFTLYKSGKNTIYIKTDTDGMICVVRKIW